MTETTKAVMRASVYDISIAGNIPRAAIDLARNTYFKECKDDNEFALCLTVCNHLGVSPLDRQVFATRFQTNLVPTISHDFLMARARNAGFIVRGAAVYKDDIFDGFDAVECKPLRHVTKGTGVVVGAWANASDLNGKLLFGQYWPIAELVNFNSPTHKSMPGHMAKKTAEARISRLACPTMLKGTYTPEELGAGSSDDLSTSADAPREPITRAAVVTDTKGEVKNVGVVLNAGETYTATIQKPGFDVDAFERSEYNKKQAAKATTAEPESADDGWSDTPPGEPEKPKSHPCVALLQDLVDTTTAGMEAIKSTRVEFIMTKFSEAPRANDKESYRPIATEIEEHIIAFLGGKLTADTYKPQTKYTNILKLLKAVK